MARIRSKRRVITPNEAEQLLHGNENRPLDQDMVQQLAEDMKSGDWKQTNVVIGLDRNHLPTSQIAAATFHPFSNDWYVISKSEGQPCIATFTNRICTDIKVYPSEKDANNAFIQLWKDLMELVDEERERLNNK